MEQTVYLRMTSLAEARDRFLSRFDWIAMVGAEEIPTVEALGRVTEQPVAAKLSAPAYNGAAMDGFAVLASSTFGAGEDQPRRLHIGTEAFPVNTGHPLPPGTDAVIMIEQVHRPDPETLEIRAAAFPWQHVRRVGEDIVAGELALPHHQKLSAVDLAALLTAGVYRLRVLGRPRVAILPTGSELVDWQEAEQAPPGPGRIIESNAILLCNLVREAGGEPVVLPRQPDRFEAIRGALEQALASDAHLIVLNAGASAGTEDFTMHVLGELGQVLVHGITAMPGKPTILGEARGKPVVGSPGYPVSAWVCFDQFVRPALAKMQGQEPPERDELTVVPARPLTSKLGVEEFLRVHLGRVGDSVVATPLKRGAGVITSLTRADGILRIPAQSEGLDQGQTARAELLRPRRAVEGTLVVVGSHDITLDILGDHIRRRARGIFLSASNVGSLGGLIALREGRSHLGGTHLLDPESGEYNVSFIRRYLAGTRVRLVTLAFREQGLIVQRGNPQGITGLADLTRVSFVNRQAGSGTRVLLDYHLGRLGVDPAAIKGYQHEEYTHMAVAVQVLAGQAQAGLGILAAARALGLDFIPVATERYDLCVPVAHLKDHRVEAVLETLGTTAFREAVEALGGYDVSPMGQTAWEG